MRGERDTNRILPLEPLPFFGPEPQNLIPNAFPSERGRVQLKKETWCWVVYLLVTRFLSTDSGNEVITNFLNSYEKKICKAK